MEIALKTNMNEGCWVCDEPTRTDMCNIIKISDFLYPNEFRFAVHICYRCSEEIRKHIDRMRALHILTRRD